MGVTFTEEQQAVIDARKCNILVSAAAGSGKTAVLVERIIQMIGSDTDIDHLLVVTFTKAAASQMREKITAAIQERLLKDPDNRHLQKQETLIHNAQITTIDSFCQYVLRNNFNVIGIDPSFHVGDDGEMRLLQEEVMSQLLEEEYALAFENQNGDGENTDVQENEGSDFLYCMDYFGTGHNDRKVEEYILQLYRFAMSMPWPEDWINERASDYDVQGREASELSFIQSCVSLAKLRIKEMLLNLETAEAVCCESDGPYSYGPTLDSDKSAVEALLRYDTYDDLFDGLRTTYFEKLKPIRDNSVNPDKKEYVQKLRDKVKKEVQNLTNVYFALPLETLIDQMKLCDRAVKELCRLTLKFKALFDEKKREKQIIDFSDMEHFALQILVEHPSKEECEGLSVNEIIDKCRPSTVAYEYRDYYKEVLIDEYQDSNNVQELILKSISGDEPDVSERFMVGDVKQSIYKFRLARPEIFMEKLDSYRKEIGSKNRRIDLHKNFRSRKEVLEITNYIFEKIMGRDLGNVDYDLDARLVTGAVYEEPVMNVDPEIIMFDAANDPGSELSDYDPREKEALVISERIHELIRENRELKYRDIVILLRSLSGWDEVFKKVLEDQGIPAYIESKSGYFDAGEVATMLDLLTIIDNPSIDIPLVSVMHSIIGGFSDEELADLKILTGSDEDASLEDSFYCALKALLKKGRPDTHFYEDGTKTEKAVAISETDKLLEKVLKFVEFIEDLRTRSVYTPVHELLQYIVASTGFDNYCLALPQGSQRKANLDQLLEKALAFEKTSFKGLFHFVRYIEHMKVVQVDYGEAGILDENADVVRIMSIHKSKGLEFPVVFVAGTTKTFNKMDTLGDLVVDMDQGLGVKCIDLENRVKYDTLKRLMISDKMQIDNIGEELRVLYVALTRAKEKLIITGCVKGLTDEITADLKALPLISKAGALLPYSNRSSAGSYFEMILLSVIRHPAFEKVLDKLEIAKDIYLSYIDKTGIKENVSPGGDKTGGIPSLKIEALSDDEIVAAMIKRDVQALVRKKELEDNTISFDNDLADRLVAKFESKYAYESLKGLFTKTTVTELKKHKLEEMGEDFNTSEMEFDADYGDETAYVNEDEDAEDAEKAQTGNEKNKLFGEKKLTGAERGTAYHRVMEILDDSIYGNEKLMNEAALKGDVSKRLYAFLCDMTDRGMIPKEYKKCVWTHDINTFLSTNLAQRMGKAFREGKLMREKPFMMGISAHELDPKFPEEEMVLIQGIIDAWFYEGDEIVLMDYKTDRVKEPSELIRRYQIQLDLYKRALEAATKKKVKEVYIYSFGLGCEIKV
ncbi:MAG: helicase-exonuclease AddAB subunit AddA [Butyrivibrio sp.]|nr:helicase-exonuclease AddAB subunit AddA [Butyrivibrio sp.]